MPLPDREGRFRFERIASGWQPEKEARAGEDKKATAFCIQMRLLEFWDGQAWYPCDDQGWEITGYFYPIKKDETLNVVCIEQLLRVFPTWNGNDFVALHSYQGVVRGQVEIKSEKSTKGEDKLKAQWLSEWDYEPGFKPASVSVAQSIQKKFGHLLKPATASTPRQAAPPQRQSARPLPPGARNPAQPPPSEPCDVEAEMQGGFDNL